MRSNGWSAGVVLLMALLMRGGAAEGGATPKVKGCRSAVIEGEVRAGSGLRSSFGGGLDVLLEPIASGWVVRVIPADGERPKVDYAEIASPPYRSVSPLLLSTDFSFRAQDAIGWNPRRFRYAGGAASYARLEPVYRRVTAAGSASAADEAALGRLVSEQPSGVLEILDAGLVPGTADPTRAAALVSTHFPVTAHKVEQPQDGKATPLGRITFLRVRVRLALPKGAAAAPGVRVESSACDEG